MLTEFAFLATLTLNADEIEALRIEINNWVKCFLPRLKRESTRTAQCRLIASVTEVLLRDMKLETLLSGYL
jgi:hypothetical protein